jgi:hypothetical protein
VADGSFNLARRGRVSFADHRVKFFGYIVDNVRIADGNFIPSLR